MKRLKRQNLISTAFSPSIAHAELQAGPRILCRPVGMSLKIHWERGGTRRKVRVGYAI